MKKNIININSKVKKIITISLVILLFCFSMVLGLCLFFKSDDIKVYAVENKVSSKTKQQIKILEEYPRTLQTTVSNEGLNERYPVYGTSLSNITDEEKDALIKESSLLIASSSTYTEMDENGNLYLNGESIGKKLYKHTASDGMYYGNVFSNEKSVTEKITLEPLEQRNYITGLYAPAGEVIKIEISKEDLEKTGGLKIILGQTSHRNVQNNIWKARNDFSRMPQIANIMDITKETSYVGTFLGGPIYIYSEKQNIEFSVTIKGAVRYPYYIHGYTTKEEFEEMKTLSAPYFDFEIWNTGVRHSGSKNYANFDYDNLVKVGNLWEKICQTSRQVPNISNKYIGVCFVYDCFVAAGAACAFTGGNTWVNAPCNWMSGSLDYESMISDGFWGQIHEFNHHYQNYGIAPILEVTNNATSLLSYVSYTNISSKRSENDSTLGGGWNRYTDPTRSLRETINNGNIGQTTLNIYADIIHSFGVETFVKATNVNPGKSTVDTWYQSLCEATGYNFTYYFETLLGHSVSSEMKSNYENLPTFVPVALLYQTGRNYYKNGKECYSNTVRPYQINYGEELILDFENYLIKPNDFDFKIEKITNPKNGTIKKISSKKYKYIPSKEEYSGEFKVTISLINSKIKTQKVTFTINIKQSVPNLTKTKYIYSEKVYNSIDNAYSNNFVDFSDKTIKNENSTFLNGISKNQIGLVEGKIYIPSTNTYTFCLRAGRGEHALYFGKDKENYTKKITFSGNKNGFDFDESHTISLNLTKGDFLYFKQITISNGHPDAFTELGWSYNNSKMATIPGSYLYNIDSNYVPYSFTSKEIFKRNYNYTNYSLYSSDISKQSLISSNQPAWDNTTKAENIVDGNLDTFYHTSRNNFVSTDNPCILTFDLGENKTYNQIKITGRKSGQINMPSTFDLYTGLSLDDLSLTQKFVDVDFSGRTLYANFKATNFRYYKLVIYDTNSKLSGNYNKYVCISQIDFNLSYSGTEYSCDEMSYSNLKTINSKLCTFGHLNLENKKISYTFTGTNFMLYTNQQIDAKIKIEIDGKSTTINLTKTNGKTLAFTSNCLKNNKHRVNIYILSGTIYVDSIFIAK